MSASTQSAPAQRDLPRVPDFYGDWIRLSPTWACRFYWAGYQVRCAWNRPKPPTQRQVLKVLREYEAARLEFARQLASRFGAPVVFVDRFGWISTS